MRISAELPTGVAALLGADAAKLRRLERTLADALLEEGFEEALLPILDYLDPYQPILGPKAEAELYRLVDRDGELLALRSDFTPLLGRLLAPRLETLGTPRRIFYRGEVVRRDADSPGRRRALWQIGAEILGVPGEAGEHEALERFLALLGKAGARSVRIVVGLAGALDHVLLEGRSPQQAVELAGAIERRDRSAVRGDRTLLEVVERGIPEDPERLGAGTAARLTRLESLCRELERAHPEVAISIDLAELARQTRAPELIAAASARSYYDGLVFRAYLGRAFLAVGGGGRYDGLFERLGAPVAAVGFSIGLDSLVEGLDASAATLASRRLGQVEAEVR